MTQVLELLRAGLAHQQAGRLDEAERLYRQVLDAAPQQADAWHLLGLAARARGQLERAAEYIRRAIATGREQAAYHSNLGLVRHEQGLTAEALECFRRALALRPDYAEAMNNLAMCHQALGQHEAALDTLARALALQPRLAELWVNQGISLQALRRTSEARAAYERALQLRPEYALAHGNYGTLLRELGQLDEARTALETAVRLDPHYATAHSNLATTLRDQRHYAAAESSYLRAIELRPRHAKFHFNLANLYRDLHQSDAAESAYRTALKLDPRLANGLVNLAILCQNQGRLTEARELLEQAIQLENDHLLAHDNRLLNASYQTDTTPAQFAELLARFQRQFGAPLEMTQQPHANIADPERPLRIGFVSADFGEHPVGRLITQVWPHFDRRRFSCVAYNNRATSDALTARLRSAADVWHDVVAWSDEQLAAQIRSDAIDLLVDLSGHTAGHRLLVFARRPAPVQLSWLGFAASTGLRAIDWLLTDAELAPPQSEEPFIDPSLDNAPGRPTEARHLPASRCSPRLIDYAGLNSERVWRLTDACACYEPPVDAPAVQPPPCLTRGTVTFGCFNNLIKLSDATLALWGQILQQVPDAQLLLKYQGLHDPGTQRVVRERLAAVGIESARVVLEGMSPWAEMLARYHDVDVALDPFPYTGGTTSLLALWMGVPIVTLVGATMASRQTWSILRHAELHETATTTPDEYVALAVALAHNPERLARLRQQCRPQLAASAFCNPRRFVPTLEAAFRGMWQTWCRTGGGS